MIDKKATNKLINRRNLLKGAALGSLAAVSTRGLAQCADSTTDDLKLPRWWRGSPFLKIKSHLIVRKSHTVPLTKYNTIPDSDTEQCERKISDMKNNAYIIIEHSIYFALVLIATASIAYSLSQSLLLTWYLTRKECDYFQTLVNPIVSNAFPRAIETSGA